MVNFKKSKASFFFSRDYFPYSCYCDNYNDNLVDLINDDEDVCFDYEYYFDKEDSLDVFPTSSSARYAVYYDDDSYYGDMKIDLSLAELKRIYAIAGVKYGGNDFHIWDMKSGREVDIKMYEQSMTVTVYCPHDKNAESEIDLTKEFFDNYGGNCERVFSYRCVT